MLTAKHSNLRIEICFLSCLSLSIALFCADYHKPQLPENYKETLAEICNRNDGYPFSGTAKELVKLAENNLQWKHCLDDCDSAGQVVDVCSKQHKLWYPEQFALHIYTDGAITWCKTQGNNSNLEECLRIACLAANPNHTLAKRVLDLNVLPPEYIWGQIIPFSVRSNRNPDIVKLLLDYGVDPNVKDVDRFHLGYTALMIASMLGLENIVTLLLNHAKVDINCAASDDGQTALHLAAKFGYPKIIKKLIDANADTTLKDKDNRTAYAQAKIWVFGSSLDRLAIMDLLKVNSAFNVIIVARTYKIPVDIWGRIIAYFDFEQVQKDKLITYLTEKQLCQ